MSCNSVACIQKVQITNIIRGTGHLNWIFTSDLSDARIEVTVAVTMKMCVFWNIMGCDLVEGYNVSEVFVTSIFRSEKLKRRMIEDV